MQAYGVGALVLLQDIDGRDLVALGTGSNIIFFRIDKYGGLALANDTYCRPFEKKRMYILNVLSIIVQFPDQPQPSTNLIVYKDEKEYLIGEHNSQITIWQLVCSFIRFSIIKILLYSDRIQAVLKQL
eukprot:m.103535 g.103535  ORF g.103535 m.103535 type:complete len:128 (+) comp13815_c0_seq5:575-958(+)